MKISETEAYKRYVASNHDPAAPENRNFKTPQRYAEPPTTQNKRPHGREISWKAFNRHVGGGEWSFGRINVPATR
jgi:hypothetical protein